MSKNEKSCIDVRKNYEELIGMNYGQMKLFREKFDANFFAGAGFGRMSYALGMTNDGLEEANKDSTTMKDLTMVHGKRSIEMINSGKAVTCSTKGIDIVVEKDGKIKLKQYFPCKDRVILKREDKKGMTYKMLAFPLAVGGYTAWNDKIFMALTPMKLKSGRNISRAIEDMMHKPFEGEITTKLVEERLQNIGDMYNAEFEFVLIDRKSNNKQYSCTYAKNTSKKAKGCVAIVEAVENRATEMGDEKAHERFENEVFKMEI